MVDIPYGRILKLHIASGEFTVVAQWDGEPNGLAMGLDGKLVVADYKEGIVSLGVFFITLLWIALPVHVLIIDKRTRTSHILTH